MQEKLSNNHFLYIIFSLLISIALFVLLYGVIKFEKEFRKEILHIATTDIIQITKNSADSIQELLNDSDDSIQAIQSDTLLQQQIDKKLSILLTQNLKYAYLLYKDDKGIFRFLADGAKGSDKAFVNQKFDVESARWIEIYSKKEPILIRQDLLKQLSFTYLQPIMNQDEVELLLVIDFSINKTQEIDQIIETIKNIISVVIFITLLFAIILVVQTLRYYGVKKKAYTDKLTNVYNRNYLQENEDNFTLDEYLLAALDIDFFKKINDTYGHQTGDLILKEIAKTIQLSIRAQEDLVIRYGGEEFIVLIKKKNQDSQMALASVERIFTNIRQKKFLIENGNYLYITVSIGVNKNPHRFKSFKEAFKAADSALYSAKETGRNKIVVYKD